MGTNRRRSAARLSLAILLVLGTLAVALIGRGRTLAAAPTAAFAVADLGTLGGRNSGALGVNRRGQVVGWAEIDPSSEEDFHAFLWEAGQMTDLGTLGGAASSATAVSPDRTIVGWADTASGEQRASLWTGGATTIALPSTPPASARDATSFATPSAGAAASPAAVTRSPVGTPVAETRGLAPCEDVWRLDVASKTRNLLADCVTDRPLVVPDGWTLDGDGHIVFAVDPDHGRLTGGVVMVTGASGAVRDVTIDGSGLTAPCEVDRALTALAAVLVRDATAEVSGVTVHDLRRPLPNWAAPPEGAAQSISESCGTGVAILGEDARATVSANTVVDVGYTGILVESGQATIVDNTIRESDDSGVLVLLGAQGAVGPGNVITDGVLGIQVEGEGSVATVSGNTVERMAMMAISVFHGGAGSVSANQIADVAAGITVEYAAGMTRVDGNRIERAAEVGIHVLEANAEAVGNAVGLEQPAAAGITARGGATFTARDNTVTGSGELGLYAYLVGTAAITGNTIDGPSGAIILGGEETRAVIADNTISGEPAVGIGVFDRAVAAITGNRISGASEAGIVGVSGANLREVSGNTIDASYYGIQVSEQGTRGTVSGNDISDGWRGIVVERGASADLRSNTIAATTQGIAVLYGARATVSDNAISGGATGVLITDHMSVIVEGNTIRDVTYAGVVFERSAATATAGKSVTADEQTEIASHDIYFEPKDVSIPANTDVTIMLPNSGVILHNFSIDQLGVSVDIPPGETQQLIINAPEGDYEYYCNIPGHKEAGMVGTLNVSADAATPAAATPVATPVAPTPASAAELEDAIRRNTIEGNQLGIVVKGAGSLVKVEGNHVRSVAKTGISIEDQAMADLVGNTVDDASTGITIAGPGTRATLTGNRVTDTTGRGVYVQLGAEALLRENTVTRAGTSGIAVSGTGTSSTLEGNFVINAAESGMVIERAAAMIAEANYVTGGKWGISILGSGTSAEVRGNQVRNTSNQGIVVTNGAQATIVGNQVTGGDTGIYLRSEGTTGIVTGNWVSDPIKYGIYVFEGATAERIEENTVIGGRVGIAVIEAGAAAIVTGNTVRDARLIGIEGRAAEITITDNIVGDSRQFGIQVGPDAVVEVNGNTITGPDEPDPDRDGPYGIRVLPGVSGTITGNQVANHRNPDPEHTACGIVIDAEAPDVVVYEDLFPDPGNEVDMCDERPRLLRPDPGPPVQQGTIVADYDDVRLDGNAVADVGVVGIHASGGATVDVTDGNRLPGDYFGVVEGEATRATIAETAIEQAGHAGLDLPDLPRGIGTDYPRGRGAMAGRG